MHKRSAIIAAKMTREILNSAKEDAVNGFTDLDGESVETYVELLSIDLRSLSFKELMDTHSAMVGSWH
tara:strand:+ start:2125 stop:2328 length:204 start_codon:yes stop_codon:yes gene_type:complete